MCCYSDIEILLDADSLPSTVIQFKLYYKVLFLPGKCMHFKSKYTQTQQFQIPIVVCFNHCKQPVIHIALPILFEIVSEHKKNKMLKFNILFSNADLFPVMNVSKFEAGFKLNA